MQSNAIKTQSEIGQFTALADRAQQIANRKQALDIDLEDAPDEFKGKARNKSCLVVLHCPPLIFEYLTQFFRIQKKQNKTKKKQKKNNSLWEFWSFKNIF